MADQSRPLSDWERRILREMIRLHQSEEVKKKVYTEVWSTWKRVAVLFGAVTIFTVQIATFVVSVRGGK